MCPCVRWVILLNERQWGLSIGCSFFVIHEKSLQDWVTPCKPRPEHTPAITNIVSFQSLCLLSVCAYQSLDVVTWIFHVFCPNTIAVLSVSVCEKQLLKGHTMLMWEKNGMCFQKKDTGKEKQSLHPQDVRDPLMWVKQQGHFAE